jgi:murein DD-endopeptidase MepM/ murein hydrolase activator NlpD
LTNELLASERAFADHINQTISGAGALYGIGGYAEHRTVYSMSAVFDGEAINEEPRRLHLGTDIWGPAGTKVMAPLEGRVHSFAFNNQLGDYGATIILQHEWEGYSFYTLYGHLSLASIQSLQKQEHIGAGQAFSALGQYSENGGWPPHLHFQIILDIGDRQGDYPGVCRYSEKERWLANSPDPDLLLQMNRFIIPRY